MIFIYKQPEAGSGAGGWKGALDSLGKVGGIDSLGMVADFMSGGPDMDMDKLTAAIEEGTKKNLEALKQNQNVGVGANILNEALTGLRTDLDELGITDPAKRQAYEKQLTDKFNGEMTGEKLKAIAESPEKKDLDTFVMRYKGMTGLQAIIDSATPESAADERAKQWRKDNLKYAGSVGSLLAILTTVSGWFKSKEEKGVQTSWEKKLQRIAAILSGKDPDKGKKTPAPAPAPAAPPAQAETQKPAELTDAQKKMLKPLEDEGFKVEKDNAKVVEDINFLVGKGVGEEKIESLAKQASKGNLKTIKGVMRTAVTDKLNFRLKDIYFAKFSSKNLKIVTNTLEGNSDKYAIKSDDPAKVREFLDAALKDKDLPETELAAYKKSTESANS